MLTVSHTSLGSWVHFRKLQLPTIMTIALHTLTIIVLLITLLLTLTLALDPPVLCNISGSKDLQYFRFGMSRSAYRQVMFKVFKLSMNVLCPLFRGYPLGQRGNPSHCHLGNSIICHMEYMTCKLEFSICNYVMYFARETLLEPGQNRESLGFDKGIFVGGCWVSC